MAEGSTRNPPLHEAALVNNLLNLRRRNRHRETKSVRWAHDDLKFYVWVWVKNVPTPETRAMHSLAINLIYPTRLLKSHTSPEFFHKSHGFSSLSPSTHQHHRCGPLNGSLEEYILRIISLTVISACNFACHNFFHKFDSSCANI